MTSQPAATAAGAVPAARVPPEGRTATRPGARWHAEIDSYDPAAPARAAAAQAGDQVTVGPRSVVVFHAIPPR